MSGWGRVSSLLAAAVVLGVGCGGRTGALEGGYESGGDAAEGGSISRAGASAQAGRSTRGGSGNLAGSGTAGSTPAGGAFAFGGTYPGAGAPSGGYGGSIVYPVGGYGGYGGAISFGGYGGYGGAISFGGYGGYGFGGVYTVGGYGGGSGGSGPQACAECLLQSCTQPFSQCLGDFGCLAIISCVQSKGCQTFECYSPEYCQTTIDQWGGPAGSSMSTLLQTLSCAVQAGCSCN